MGMVLEHELTASYAAGSLGGTLGRLEESLRRLSRAQSTGSREKPGVDQESSITVANLASLHQTLRSMADAWQVERFVSKRFSDADGLFSVLKERILNHLLDISEDGVLRGFWPEYQSLAQALNILRTSESM